MILIAITQLLAESKDGQFQHLVPIELGQMAQQAVV
jgi:hypothetical protein